MSYTPQRTQYPYAGIPEDRLKRLIAYKSRGDILRIQEQWNTFETVENFDDIVYQRLEAGDRSQLFYQFVSDQEFKNYKAGQQLHIITYPELPCTTFDSISNRPMPVPVGGFINNVPQETGLDRFVINSNVPTSSEQAMLASDLTIFTYVNTYNATHRIKYVFVDDDEKKAYERACIRINAPPAS